MTTIKDLQKLADELVAEISTLDDAERERLGEQAFNAIGDYPLYAATSNISYDDAIAVALITNGLV